MMKSKRQNGKKKEYILEGRIGLGRKWDPDNVSEFHIRFGARHFFHAKRIALGRLKGLAKRRLEKSNQSKFMLQKVTLISCVGNKKSTLRSECKNNGLLFKRKVAEVFC